MTRGATVTPSKSANAKSRRKAKSKNKILLSPMRKPPEMSLEQWQRALRQQVALEQKFKLKNLGEEEVFSDFQVTNPSSKGSYRVSIRGGGAGENFCTCPDFVTNSLGTCKHIEFTLARVRSQRGGRFALKNGFTPTFSEIRLQYGARRQVRFYPGSECPAAVRKAAAAFFGSDGILMPEAFGRFEQLFAIAEKNGHELRCGPDVLSFVAEVRDGDERRRRIDAAFPHGIESREFERLLKKPLYDYQRQGALFAARAGRCLIGDEMGLGKTIQAIAAAEILAQHMGIERVLIICPTSLKHQWQREIDRFCSRPARVIGGLRAERQRRFAEPGFYKITNYDTVYRDLDLITQWSPDLVILDEAQRIKNWNTRTARNVKQVRSPYAIVLTGTPLENRLEELVSIVQFVDQYRLGPTFRFLADHQVHDDDGRVIGYRDLDTVGQTLSPILLRRHKSDVLKQLPDRLDKHLFVQMTPQQMNHHEENREIVAKIVHKWRARGFLSEQDRQRLMIALQNMRMSCDSTFLLDQETDFGNKADELATLLEEIFETDQTKVVIFSQWLRMHEVLLRRLRTRRWGHVLFHGGVPSEKRRSLIDQFRDDGKCRAFLSTDAGGVGLNLQHASVVMNVDLPWNPAVLEQRIGRVHRLGQQQPVRVINFVSSGTIEEGMLSVLKFKKSLFAGALDGGEKDVFLGGSRLKQFMETVEKTTEAIPADTAEPAAEIEPPESAQAVEPAPPSGIPSDRALLPALPTVAGANTWDSLLQTGLALLQEISAASRGTPPATSDHGRNSAPSIVHRDEHTGQPYLRLPMPTPEALDRILSTVGTLLQGFRK